MQPLVNTEWLAAELCASDLVVFDASYYLPSEPHDASAEYRLAHLPTALWFDIDEFADPASTLPHMVPSTARFEQLLAALGVCDRDRVVFYDQRGVFSAPRGWWLLRLFGHERCAVLDGGLPKWRAEGRALEAGAPRARAAATYRARLQARYLRGLGDMIENLSAARELVLDARSNERFHARVSEPRPGVRGGHIPGSRNLPFGELLTAQQTFRTSDELRARFAARGVGADSAVITSCGSGLTAAVLSLGLELAGLPSGALYDGSWSEWGSRSDTPIEV